MGAKSGQTKKLAGRQRLALVVFAALFVLLFIGFAIAQGIGEPSVPSGDVALIEEAPEGTGNVSEADFRRTMVHQAGLANLKKPPEPGESKYDELKQAALEEIFDAIWIAGEAAEMGISVTPKQIATELEQIKKQNFKTEAAYKEFLKTSRFTQEEVNDRVKTQILGTQIQERISQETPQPSNSEVEAYYDSVKDTQFTTAESRDIRTVVNKDKAKVEEAQAALEKDNSPASWEKIAAKFSSDPTTKDKGGLQPALSEELLQGQTVLKEAVFGNARGDLVGPIDVEGNFFVIEVVALNPKKVQALKEVSAQIKSQLAQQIQQEVFSEFVAEYQSKWQSRTFCADGFVIERCANYVGSGRPSTVPPACYEADPKGGRPKDCPAPVTQPAPALPGSTTLLEPQGKRLPQRPRPEGIKAAAEEALPEGVPPSSGAAGAPPPTAE